jgi:hypothetical protein
MSRVGFEPRTPVFERAKTVHALDRAATVIAILKLRCNTMFSQTYLTGSFKHTHFQKYAYNLNLVGVQEVTWDRGGIEPTGEYTFFYGKGSENHELGTGFSCT